MITPHPRFQVYIAKQLARSILAAAHPPSPNLVGGNELPSAVAGERFFNGLLGAKAVIVESFERIHRANLVGMSVLLLQFKNGVGRRSLKLDGSEHFDIVGVANQLAHVGRLLAKSTAPRLGALC